MARISYNCKFCTATNNISYGDINDKLPIYRNDGMGPIKTSTVRVRSIKTINENFIQGENSAVINQLDKNVGVESIKTATVVVGSIKTINENFTHRENSVISNQLDNNAIHINREITTNSVIQSHTFTQEENDNIEHPSSIENDAPQDFKNICEFCRCNIKSKNKNVQCNTCFSSFHSQCYRKA